MDAIPRFTKSDIEALKEAREALHRIDCINITCPACPLYMEKRCIANHLGYIAKKAEAERSLYYGS